MHMWFHAQLEQKILDGISSERAVKIRLDEVVPWLGKLASCCKKETLKKK